MKQDGQPCAVVSGGVPWMEMLGRWKELLANVSSKHIAFEQAIVALRKSFSDSAHQSIDLAVERDIDPRVMMLWGMGQSKMTSILRPNGAYIDWVTQNPLREDILQKEKLRRQLTQAIEDVNLLRHQLRRLSWIRKIRKQAKLESKISDQALQVDTLKDQLSKQQTKIEQMMNFWTGGVIERFVDELTSNYSRYISDG